MDMTEKGKGIFRSGTAGTPEGYHPPETVILPMKGKGASATFSYRLLTFTAQIPPVLLGYLAGWNAVFRDHVKANDSLGSIIRTTSTGFPWCHYYKRIFRWPTRRFHLMRVSPRLSCGFRLPDTTAGHPVLTLNRRGFYHFRIDTTRKEGFTIFSLRGGSSTGLRCRPNAGSVALPDDQKTHEELKSNPHPRQAVDGFWIERAANEERTRMLIRKYYTRVQDANRFFSSYTEGWRTDRG